MQNGDFRYVGGWTENSSCTGNDDYAAPADVPPDVPQLDGNYYKIVGNRTKTKTVSQTVQVSGKADDSFVLAGWAKGYSVPLDSSNDFVRHFAVRARFKYTDNTNSDYFYATFNVTTRQWQYAATPMVAKKAYSSITVELIYQNNVNTVYFDGIQLYKEEFGSSYTYADEEDGGEVISVVDAQKKRTDYKYNKNGNLTQILEDNNAKVTYTYDDNHNVETAVTEEGLTYSFEYDQWGNNTKVTISGKDTVSGKEVTISSTATYKENGKFLDYSTDALGKTTYYGYNVDTGALEWVQYPNDSDGSDGELDTRTKYTYDSMYRQAAAVCQISEDQTLSASYEYTDDYLTTIRTPTTTYNFEYGVFGLRQSVTAGDKTLATYSYNGDWDLQRQTYGNGDYISYTYDTKGRPTVETHVDMSGVGDDATEVGNFTVKYFYDNDGNLASVKDGATDRTITHYYDLLGRPMKSVESGTNYTHSVEYAYNEQNNLETLIEVINGTTRTTAYEYDKDNRVTSVTTDDTPDDDTDGVTVTYTYDDFGRVTEQVTSNGVDEEGNPNIILTEAFGYATRTVTDENGTDVTLASGQVATYTTTAGGNTVTYSYEYDDNGNITSTVSTNSNTNSDTATSSTTTYEYDSANQLIRENNQAGNFTHTWTYDNAGNIRERKEYLYSDGDLSAATRTVNYGYPTVTDPENNTVWGDLLTSFDGKAIEYDAIGNPTKFGVTENSSDRTYTWEHGRQLKSLTEGDTTWNYTYDAGGMRTDRTDGDTTYQYIYNGSQLTQMTVDTDGNDTVGITLAFTYDASGVPLTVTYGSTTYYYATNIQGDVVAILNADGTTAASYTYDAWGKCLNSYTSGIGFLNPLRYRGYVYDRETQLYYLQSRYYNPAVGRFLNADGLVSTGQGLTGNNMFAYCGNNAACRIDAIGESWGLAVLGGCSITSYVSLSSIGASVLGALSAISPVGWVVIGTVAVAGIIAVSVASSKTTKPSITEERSERPIGRRKHFNTKKEAKEAAKKAGGGKEPIHHPKGCHGNREPHYHPNVKNTYRTTPHGTSTHDHYIYPG